MIKFKHKKQNILKTSNVNISEEHKKIARKFGNGKISKGIRHVLELHNKIYKEI